MAGDRSAIEVDARPSALSLDLRRTAVVVVDMQNDFGADLGMFSRAGIPIDDIKAVIKPIAALLAEVRRAGILVIYLQMQFEPDLSDTGGPDAPNYLKHLRLGVGENVTSPDGRPGRVLVRDTWNTEIVGELTPQAGDLVVAKHRFSGFFETDLDEILQDHQIEALIVTGCTTSVCVDATIRDAFYRDYRCLLLADCTAEPLGSDCARSNRDATLLTVEALFGWVTDSQAVLTALASQSIRA